MEQKSKNIILIFIFLLVILLWSKLNSANDQILEYEDQVAEYKEALEQANNNIEEASSYAWESYEDMGYILESLETVSVY